MIDPHVTGFVLAGGLSRRMGTDKALVEFRGRTLLDRAVDCLTAAGCESIVVLHRDPSLASVDEVVFRRDDGGGEGPLDGIVTALRSSSSGIVVTLPVDTPCIEPGDITRLIAGLESGSDFDVTALSDGGSIRQHLAAAWRRDRCLDPLRSAFEAGERSVRRAMAELAIQWSIVDSTRLLNINTLADLDPSH